MQKIVLFIIIIAASIMLFSPIADAGNGKGKGKGKGGKSDISSVATAQVGVSVRFIEAYKSIYDHLDECRSAHHNCSEIMAVINACRKDGMLPEECVL